jgi:hypothetical protein
VWLLALTVHAVFVFLWLRLPQGRDPALPSPWQDLLPIALSSPREVTVRYHPWPGPGGLDRIAPQVAVTVASRPGTPVRVAARPAELPLAADVATPQLKNAAVAEALGPRFAQGRVWVRPLPEAPRQIGEAFGGGRSPAELVDSAVTTIVQHYLDAMAIEAIARKAAAPSWITTVAGQRVGLDAQWVYIGPLKVPTFLLGLLPINLQGNPTQADFNRKLMVMREDIFVAARRSDNLAEFKKAVKQLRVEKQRQRELDEHQRIAPDSTGP